MASLAKPNSARTAAATRHNEKVRWFLVKETIQLELEFLDAVGTQSRRNGGDQCARSLSGTSISQERKKKSNEHGD
jgi:hypothetical protein